MFDKIATTEMPNAFSPIQAEKITIFMKIFQITTVKNSEKTSYTTILFFVARLHQ